MAKLERRNRYGFTRAECGLIVAHLWCARDVCLNAGTGYRQGDVYSFTVGATCFRFFVAPATAEVIEQTYKRITGKDMREYYETMSGARSAGINHRRKS